MVSKKQPSKKQPSKPLSPSITKINKRFSKGRSKSKSTGRITTILKTTKLVIKVGKKTSQSKLNSLNLSSTGLLYIGWDTGRTYMKLGLKDDYIQKIQKSFLFDDTNRTFSFRWCGPWESKALPQQPES
jgi:hypothetical protein